MQQELLKILSLVTFCLTMSNVPSRYGLFMLAIYLFGRHCLFKEKELRESIFLFQDWLIFTISSWAVYWAIRKNYGAASGSRHSTINNHWIVS